MTTKELGGALAVVTALSIGLLYVLPVDKDGLAIVDTLPALPADVRASLELPMPTQDGTKPATHDGVRWTSPARLETKDAAAYRLAVDEVAEIGESGAWAGLKAGQCRTVRLTVEAGPTVSDGGAKDFVASKQSETVCQISGVPPAAELLQRTERIAGRAIDVLEVGSVRACTGQPPIVCYYGAPPKAISDAYECACCARGQPCYVAGQPLPDGGVGTVTGSPRVEYRPASRVSGAGKRLKPCGEHAGVAAREGLDYSLPAECR